jgi:hypothetical protein
MDPSGVYGVDDVRVELEFVQITKGRGADGDFVIIGRPRSKTRPGGKIRALQRAVRLILLVSSESNQTLRTARSRMMVAIRIRRADGTMLFEGSGWIDSDPTDDGTERVWKLTVAGTS